MISMNEMSMLSFLSNSVNFFNCVVILAFASLCRNKIGGLYGEGET